MITNLASDPDAVRHQVDQGLQALAAARIAHQSIEQMAAQTREQRDDLIRQAHAAGFTCRYIANHVGVSLQTVTRAINRK